jgi:hypothetical protein
MQNFLKLPRRSRVKKNAVVTNIKHAEVYQSYQDFGIEALPFVALASANTKRNSVRKPSKEKSL